MGGFGTSRWRTSGEPTETTAGTAFALRYGKQAEELRRAERREAHRELRHWGSMKPVTLPKVGNLPTVWHGQRKFT